MLGGPQCVEDYYVFHHARHELFGGQILQVLRREEQIPYAYLSCTIFRTLFR